MCVFYLCSKYSVPQIYVFLYPLDQTVCNTGIWLLNPWIRLCASGVYICYPREDSLFLIIMYIFVLK